ncbi:hypothetical protein V8G54_010156 [Vigna mungo]|uniref:Uncharacterized protein n=1 Tax=Vigna mungo TaxID=3915 RepID=A0AAQ3NW60_VIGMU
MNASSKLKSKVESAYVVCSEENASYCSPSPVAFHPPLLQGMCVAAAGNMSPPPFSNPETTSLYPTASVASVMPSSDVLVGCCRLKKHFWALNVECRLLFASAKLDVQRLLHSTWVAAAGKWRLMEFLK